MEKLVVFEKVHQREDNKGEYKTYYGLVANTDTTINVKFTNECKANIQGDKNIDKFPKTFVLEEEDYFITLDEYVDENNKTHSVPVCVITSYQAIEKPILNKLTLTDYVNNKKSNEEKDLPF